MGEIKTTLVSLSEGGLMSGYFGRGGAITSGWSQYPDILTVTYQARDFAIGGWSKTSNTWMGPSFYIDSDNGNIGIGTTDPKGYKLAVAGNMIAESIRVKLQGTWPDYVFTREYRLPTLQETEDHIKEKGHLPGVPSAAEVKAKGLDLGNMDAKLLQKIEELTLYLIEMKKINEAQDENIKNLKLSNEKLIVEINQMKTKL